MPSKTHNPEKRSWRGKSHKRGGRKLISALRDEDKIKIDGAALIDVFDKMLVAFDKVFAPPKSSGVDIEKVQERAANERIVGLACSASNLWFRQRQDDRIVGKMDPLFVRLLDEVESATRGDVRRCECLAFKKGGGKHHDLQCPARPKGSSSCL